MAQGDPAARRFFEVPTGEHIAIWQDANQRMLTQSRYAALLVSIHIWSIYEQHDYVIKLRGRGYETVRDSLGCQT